MKEYLSLANSTKESSPTPTYVPNLRLCEICVTEFCAVVQSTANAMSVQLISTNNVSYL